MVLKSEASEIPSLSAMYRYKIRGFVLVHGDAKYRQKNLLFYTNVWHYDFIHNIEAPRVKTRGFHLGGAEIRRSEILPCFIPGLKPWDFAKAGLKKIWSKKTRLL